MTLLQAEARLEGNAVMQAVFLNHLLKGVDYIIGALQMAGAADADTKLNHIIAPPHYSSRVAVHVFCPSEGLDIARA